MTLAELLPAIRQLPALEKLRLIRILAEDLDTAEDIAPFEPHKIYYLPTPYNTFGAGRALMQAMQQPESPTHRRPCVSRIRPLIHRKMRLIVYPVSPSVCALLTEQ